MLTNKEIRQRGRQTLQDGIFSPAWLIGALLMFAAVMLCRSAKSIFLLALVVQGPIEMFHSAYFLNLHRDKIGAKDIMAPLTPVKSDITGAILVGAIYFLMLQIGYKLFYFPGVIVSFLFGMIYYIRLDNPDIGYFDAFKENWRLLKGHIGKYLLFKLSFIGWYILGYCTIVGVYWVKAYENASTVAFYEELRKADRSRYLPS